MFTSGTSPLTPLRTSLWHFLLFSGVAWLAIAWSMLRLEPSDAVRVAGPVVLLGAVSEALRALTGSSHWGLHCGMAVLFAATGAVLILDEDASLATPAALIGWYLLVRGAADIALSSSARGVERSWGIHMVLGVAQVAVGFYGASSYARSPGAVVWLLAALAVMRAVADLVTAVDLRDSPAGRSARERAAGVAGYAAGLADYAAAATGRASRPRHRARGLLAGRPMEDDAGHAVDMEAVLQLAGVGDAAGHGHAGADEPAATVRIPTGPTVSTGPTFGGGTTVPAGGSGDGGTSGGATWHIAAFPVATHSAAADLVPGAPTGSGPSGGSPTAGGPAGSGPTGSGPTGSGPTSSGPTSSGPTGSGPASSGPMDSGSAAGGPAGSGGSAGGGRRDGGSAAGGTATATVDLPWPARADDDPLGGRPDPAGHRVPAGPPVGMSIRANHRDDADGGPADPADGSAARRHGDDADGPGRARTILRRRAAGRRAS